MIDAGFHTIIDHYPWSTLKFWETLENPVIHSGNKALILTFTETISSECDIIVC